MAEGLAVSRRVGRRIHQRIAMRDPFTFETPPTTRDSFGERESGTWVEAFKSRGDLRPVRGVAFAEGQTINSEFTHVITIRYRPAVRAGMRAVKRDDSRVFDIRSVDNVEGMNRWLRLQCTENAPVTV